MTDYENAQCTQFTRGGESVTCSATGFSLHGRFSCAGVTDVKVTGPGQFSVRAAREEFPRWFQNTLEELFGGAGVPREYYFAFRLEGSGGLPAGMAGAGEAEGKAEVTVYFPEHRGKNYLAPPYWVLEGTGWRQAAADEYTLLPDRRGAVFSLSPGRQGGVTVALQPFITPAEVVRRCRRVAAEVSKWEYTSIGTTPLGNPIPALAPRDPGERLRILVDASMQGSEQTARAILSLPDWLEVSTAEASFFRKHCALYLLPMTNPDGAQQGRCATNSRGEVPKFSLGAAATKRPDPPLESAAWWEYVLSVRPHVVIEVHSHNRWGDFWRTAGAADPSVLPEELQPRGRALLRGIRKVIREEDPRNGIVLLDYNRKEHAVYGDRYLIERGILRGWLQTDSRTIDGQAADLRAFLLGIVRETALEKEK